jgi:hypothetical protein
MTVAQDIQFVQMYLSFFTFNFHSCGEVVPSMFGVCFHISEQCEKREKVAKSLFCLHAFGNVHPAINRHYILHICLWLYVSVV